MLNIAPQIKLKKGREKPVLRRHPWIYSGSIDRVLGAPESGETVKILSHRGQFLAWGAYSPRSQIRVRVWSRKESARIDREFFRQRIQRAVAFRQAIDLPGNAGRLVYGESDGIPGLIIDKYANHLVVQFLSAGVERWREDILQVLEDVVSPDSIYERSDAEVRKLEGLEEQVGLLSGVQPPDAVRIEESGRRYLVDIRRGHKTGFYLDQRENRDLVQGLAAGKTVLDGFSYSGGFSVAALTGGAASVTALDSSSEALSMAAENVALNELPEDRFSRLEGDAFAELRTLRDQNRRWDLIILDPPKFAPTSSHARQAARGYKDINLWAFKILKPGGTLVTFSCSGGIDRAFFQKIIADAALDAGVRARMIRQLWQGPDHAVDLAYPEGDYLKGFVVKRQD